MPKNNQYSINQPNPKYTWITCGKKYITQANRTKYTSVNSPNNIPSIIFPTMNTTPLIFKQIY